MRLLLDECVPRRFKDQFREHDVCTAGEMGWASKRNGELLQLAAANNFDCLLTVDQNLEYQQNVSTATIGLVVIDAKSNRLDDLLPLVPQVKAALTRVRAGMVVRVVA